MQLVAMNTERINELLERYYEALTTEGEEEELRRFFTEGEVPAHLMGERELFLQLQAASTEVSVPEGLGDRLSEAIDEWAAKEERPKHSRIYRLRWIGGIAASVLMVVAFSWNLYEPARKDTCSTPEEAYAEAHNALMQFAQALNKGTEQLAMVHGTTQKIEENINEYLTLTIE